MRARYFLGRMLSNTAPFREALARAIPSRPFSVELWDGSSVPSTNGGGPTFHVRSPDAFAHAVMAPGQLGLGRAYVAGALDVDDLDAVLEVLDGWEPPPLDRREQARLALAAARASGVRRPPRPPKTELRPRGKRHSLERDARAVRHHYDVSNDFFKLFLGDVAHLQLRDLLARRQDLGGGAGGEARAGLHQARARARPARARRGLRLGQLRAPRGASGTA